MGAGNKQVRRVIFDSCLKLELHGSKVTSAAGLTPAGRKSRADEVLEAMLCLRSVENRCGTRARDDAISPGVRNPVVESQRKLAGTGKEDTMLVNETELSGWLAGRKVI